MVQEPLLDKLRVAGLVLCVGLTVAGLLASGARSTAQTPSVDQEPPQYAPRGAATCLTCHNNPTVNAIVGSPHGVKSNPRTPFANHECESCHGPSPSHYQSLQPPTVVFGKGNGRFPASDVATQNAVCMGCHATGERLHWASSEHEFANVACTSCHTLHQETNLVPQGMYSVELCLDCHLEKRAQINQRSHHPLTEGLMTCTSCHNPHGSDTVALLAQASLNDTCTDCHTEKRGPFLWEHEPVTDSCTNCHNPHGSTQSRLLTVRAPFLCQTCHSDAFHPSTLYSGTGLPPTGAAQQMLGTSCMNCHSQVHGSNHPSGSRLTR